MKIYKLMRLKFQKRSALKFDGRIIPEAKPGGINAGRIPRPLGRKFVWISCGLRRGCSLLLMLLVFLFLPAVSIPAEIGSALKADVLRKQPYSDAKKTGNMARGEKLQILGKKGAWLNVKTAKTAGWVRLLSVKRGISGGGNQIKGVLDVASGRSGTGKVVATTGVRGLNEEELKNAKYNEADVKKLESYTQTPQQAMQFASSGGLKAIKFAYLPASQKGGAK